MSFKIQTQQVWQGGFQSQLLKPPNIFKQQSLAKQQKIRQVNSKLYAQKQVDRPSASEILEADKKSYSCLSTFDRCFYNTPQSVRIDSYKYQLKVFKGLLTQRCLQARIELGKQCCTFKNIRMDTIASSPGGPVRSQLKKYAVIEISGGQMIVEEGRFYDCNKLKAAEVGSTIAFGRVLLAKLGHRQYKVGQPYLQDVQVQAEVVAHYKADKLMVYKFKPKLKHYKRKKGHRQHMSRFHVKLIKQN